MARIWKSTIRDSQRLIHREYIHVYVCSFEFTFSDLAQVEKYLTHFKRKTHPSSRDGVTRSPWAFVIAKNGKRQWIKMTTHHDERQSCFDRLPLYLFEEPKRKKVVKALEATLRKYGTNKKSGD